MSGRRKYENIYEEKDGYTNLKIHSEKFGDFNIAIDNDDVDRVKQHHWGISQAKSSVCEYFTFYVYTNTKEYKSYFLHRFLTNCPKGMVVDHKDGDTMNNRKGNLRICAYIENSMNRKMQKNNKSGRTGVFYLQDDAYINKWLASITIERKVVSLGYYYTYEEAAAVREEAEKKYFGEFLRQENTDINASK